MEESTLFFEMQLRNVVEYQKIKYTQFQDYISFKLIEEKSYSVMNCKIEQQNRTAIKDIQYPNIKKCSIWFKEHNLYIEIVTKD